MNKSFNVITAYCHNRGIGLYNKLPWPHLKEDMQHFKHITSNSIKGKQNAVIMGRKTFESIQKPLSNRLNVVISRSNNYTRDNVVTVPTLSAALNVCNNKYISDKYIIGGSSVYYDTLYNYGLQCDNIYATEIDKEYNVDRFFPTLPEYFKLVDSFTKHNNEHDINMTFKTFKNIADIESEENEYLECLNDILTNGERIRDRTGVGTLSLFGKNMKFNISTFEKDGMKMYKIPMLTTKKMYFRGILVELLWFLRGGINASWLQDRNVHIWDGNTSREFLDSRGLYDYNVGDIGPGYGHQWVNWGGDWRENTNIEHSTGINQIENIIETLKTDPTSRRCVLSAWNVSDVDKMALPPCHMMYVFKVSDHHKDVKTLNCKVLLRSNDMFLGSPFNILSTSLLTVLIGKVVGMNPGAIELSIVDAHIYVDHIEQVKKQLDRMPIEFPYLTVDANINSWEDMLGLDEKNFTIHNYHSWKELKGKMAV